MERERREARLILELLSRGCLTVSLKILARTTRTAQHTFTQTEAKLSEMVTWGYTSSQRVSNSNLYVQASCNIVSTENLR